MGHNYVDSHPKSHHRDKSSSGSRKFVAFTRLQSNTGSLANSIFSDSWNLTEITRAKNFPGIPWFQLIRFTFAFSDFSEYLSGFQDVWYKYVDRCLKHEPVKPCRNCNCKHFPPKPWPNDILPSPPDGVASAKLPLGWVPWIFSDLQAVCFEKVQIKTNNNLGTSGNRVTWKAHSTA
jgi:hypothetical protein